MDSGDFISRGRHSRRYAKYTSLRGRDPALNVQHSRVVLLMAGFAERREIVRRVNRYAGAHAALKSGGLRNNVVGLQAAAAAAAAAASTGSTGSTDRTRRDDYCGVVAARTGLAVLGKDATTNLKRGGEKLAVHVQTATDFETVHRRSAARFEPAIVDEHPPSRIRVDRQMIRPDRLGGREFRKLQQFVKMGREEEMGWYYRKPVLLSGITPGAD